MANALTPTGITTNTATENSDALIAAYQAIYGPNIIVTSESQDGQTTQIFVQLASDMGDLVVGVYSSFDINQAVGVQLDQRLFWIQRLGGIPTIQPVVITVAQALTLYGLNQTLQPVFTVADASGNQWELISTVNIASPGANTLSFEAANPGAIVSAVNTITVPVTVVLGVSSINNPNTYTTLGTDEETDAAFRLRGLASVSIPSQGFFNALFSTIKNTTGEANTILLENYLDSTSPNAVLPSVSGVPGHCIWAISQGTATASAIAEDIYNQRTLGCNMKGAQTFPITQDDGSVFVVQWDDVTTETLYIWFTATSIDGIHPPNIGNILQQLPILMVLAVGATVNVNQVQAAVQQIDPNTLVTNAGLSTSSSGPFTNTLSPTALNYQFVLLTGQIFITPMVLLPQTSNATPTNTIQFTGYGGTQTGYTYSISVNASGGSINGSTGVYTAGASAGTDTVLVTDSASNTASASVVVS